MLRDVGVHRVNKTDVVDAFTHVWKNVADPLAALAVGFEGKRRRHQSVFCIAQRFAVDQGRSFAGVFGQQRFVIKGVDL